MQGLFELTYGVTDRGLHAMQTPARSTEAPGICHRNKSLHLIE
jgi:hypothetical protein